MRSRASSLPRSRCRATARSPPPACTRAMRSPRSWQRAPTASAFSRKAGSSATTRETMRAIAGDPTGRARAPAPRGTRWHRPAPGARTAAWARIAEQPLRDPAHGDDGCAAAAARSRRPAPARRLRPRRRSAHGSTAACRAGADAPARRSTAPRRARRSWSASAPWMIVRRRLGPAARRASTTARTAVPSCASRPLAGEGHAREAPAAVADRLAHQQQPRAGALVQVVAQVRAPDLRRRRAGRAPDARRRTGSRTRASASAATRSISASMPVRRGCGSSVHRPARRPPPGLRGGRGGRRRR